MIYGKRFACLLAALLVIALLAGCGDTEAPAAETEQPVGTAPADSTAAPQTTAPPAEDGVIHVTNVDELLAAIAPNAVIELAAGDYDLTTAQNYGKTSRGVRYDWDLIGDPGEYELILAFVDHLTIRGENAAETRLLTRPRNSNVILFDNCRDLTVENLTIGHTEGNLCNGGVLRFDNCKDVRVNGCALFGCGIVGVWGHGCEDLSVKDSRIYECSDAAVSVDGCQNVRVENCEIDRQGKEGLAASSLFRSSNGDGFVVVGNRIHDNNAAYLLDCFFTRNAFFLSNEVCDNRLEKAVFYYKMLPGVVAGCVFTDNGAPAWISANSPDPVSADGTALDAGALESMTLEVLDPDMPFPDLGLNGSIDIEPGGTVTVHSADEFLMSIGPDRTIVLDASLIDLSSAAGYGKIGSDYYFWEECFDGMQLVIRDVSGLTIRASSEDAKATTVSALPRYAEVLRFNNCSDIELIGFTLGHTQEPGACSGGVLYFDLCSSVHIERCRLYGCGILGIQAYNCSDLSLRETEIYECSQGAGSIYNTRGVSFDNCNIHDVPSAHFVFYACSGLSWNGEAITANGNYDVGADGKLTQTD